jgi:hypothetical protein
MRQPAWERYVASLCLDAWALEPAALIRVMSDLESLIASGYLTDGTIATVLRMAGVPRSEAELIAPSIRAEIGDGHIPPHAPSP